MVNKILIKLDIVNLTDLAINRLLAAMYSSSAAAIMIPIMDKHKYLLTTDLLFMIGILFSLATIIPAFVKNMMSSRKLINLTILSNILFIAASVSFLWHQKEAIIFVHVIVTPLNIVILGLLFPKIDVQIVKDKNIDDEGFRILVPATMAAGGIGASMISLIYLQMYETYTPLIILSMIFDVQVIRHLYKMKSFQ